MRISDWSSDVCSSDLPDINRIHVGGKRREMVAAKTDGRRNPADALEAADLGKNFVAPPLNLFEHLLGVRDRAFGIEPSLRLEGLVPDCSGLRFEIALGLREAPPRRGALSPDRIGFALEASQFVRNTREPGACGKEGSAQVVAGPDHGPPARPHAILVAAEGQVECPPRAPPPPS